MKNEFDFFLMKTLNSSVDVMFSTWTPANLQPNCIVSF